MDNNQNAPEKSSLNSSSKDTQVPPHYTIQSTVLDHEQVMDSLLNQLTLVDFRVLLGLNPTDPINEKVYVVGIIMNLLKVAKANNWGLCKAFDYVYVYNGAYWIQFDKEDLKRFLGEAAAKMGYKDHESKHYEFKDKLVKQFMSAAHLTSQKKRSGKTMINLLNGTVEFSPSGIHLRPHDPVDFITYLLPFPYDPEATCPIFEKYLNEVLPEEDSRLILQEFAGYIFTDLNLEKCLMIIGPGQNGKSVWFNILRALLGSNNILEYPIGLFKHEYNRAKLANVLVNYSSEKGDDLDPDTFKALVSGEPVQAREPYGKPFTISNRVRLIFNTNDLPIVTDHTEAYFRRYLIVPFNTRIKDEDKDIDLAQKIISAELPGIFNWVIQGLMRLYANKKFTMGSASQAALDSFKLASDNVALFVSENNYDPAEEFKMSLLELYRSYREFCRDSGYIPCSKHKFSGRFEKLGFIKTRLAGGATAFYIKKQKLRIII